MLYSFLTPAELGGEYFELSQDYRRGVPSAVLGAHFTAGKALAAAISPRPVLYLAPTRQTAEEIFAQISALTKRQCALLVPKDEVILYREAFSRDSYYRRLIAAHQIFNGAEIIVADIQAAMQLLPREMPAVTLKKDAVYDTGLLTAQLIGMGYRREFGAEAKGVFSVRGDILDIFPINSDSPMRIDFFGDLLERIRPYDPVSEEKKEQISEFTIACATDIKISDGERQGIFKVFEKELAKFADIKARTRAEDIYSDIKTALAAGGASAKLSYIMPLLKHCCTIFDIISPETLIIFDEPKLLKDKADAVIKETSERVSNLKSGGEAFEFILRHYISAPDIAARAESFAKCALQNFMAANVFFSPLKLHRLNCGATQRYLYNIPALSADITAWSRNGYSVCLFTQTLARAEKMRDVLYENGIQAQIGTKIKRGMPCIIPAILERGILLHASKTAVIGSGDLYFKKPSEKRLKRKRADLFTSPEIGDFAVHEQHGVGRITGIKRIETTGGAKDYISLEYKGGDILYVPVEQMDILSKYMGGGEPPLGKIGGKEFERAKARAAASIKKLAIDLRKLYAEREAKSGFVFEPDNAISEEFENAFEFEPTPDQLTAAAEIKADMESAKVMDRLLCGDVGYGKTEVALRAVFKAVLSGKQSALLCPTTILSKQHYRTAKERFENFGVRVSVINRFCTAKEQSDILKRLAEGEIDLIIGTHRLLGKDVRFKDLGLIVLDEEQRFGVEHKEKLKSIKTDVDCLTMTATPIPRTLYMSLSGIRDISTIETPPQNRLPIETCVVEESETLIRDACVRELARGGKVFILYNRVESIYEFAAKAAQLVPEGAVTVTHGQMSADRLENNIEKFYSGECNILVTTTIIENGIDLPEANTIILIDSDRLGVAQLYQLRGRVGRSDRLAQAYFTFKGDKLLSEDAVKRLNAVMEFTELGSGFKIAMRDLEIRGAGNILGAEQHGHIAKIGYELYSKLLKQEISGAADKEPELDLKVEAHIPESYIEKSGARLDCYKKIAEIKTSGGARELADEITDTFGKMPTGVVNLITIALLKVYARGFNAEKIKIDGSRGEIIFSEFETLNRPGIIKAIHSFSGITLSVSEKPALKFIMQGNAALLPYMVKFLQNARTFTKLT